MRTSTSTGTGNGTGTGVAPDPSSTAPTATSPSADSQHGAISGPRSHTPAPTLEQLMDQPIPGIDTHDHSAADATGSSPDVVGAGRLVHPGRLTKTEFGQRMRHQPHELTLRLRRQDLLGLLERGEPVVIHGHNTYRAWTAHIRLTRTGRFVVR